MNELIEQESKTKYVILGLIVLIGVGFYFYPSVIKTWDGIYIWMTGIGPLWSWFAIGLATIGILYKMFFE